mmetsp:Transcript_25534/g.82284  ORF Transcript_25534/g.82284 Transcript_25534/m.82284 type:complete len:410 (-) Transcript_25534:21-1250(-)
MVPRHGRAKCSDSAPGKQCRRVARTLSGRPSGASVCKQASDEDTQPAPPPARTSRGSRRTSAEVPCRGTETEPFWHFASKSGSSAMSSRRSVPWNVTVTPQAALGTTLGADASLTSTATMASSAAAISRSARSWSTSRCARGVDSALTSRPSSCRNTSSSAVPHNAAPAPVLPPPPPRDATARPSSSTRAPSCVSCQAKEKRPPAAGGRARAFKAARCTRSVRPPSCSSTSTSFTSASRRASSFSGARRSPVRLKAPPSSCGSFCRLTGVEVPAAAPPVPMRSLTPETSTESGGALPKAAPSACSVLPEALMDATSPVRRRPSASRMARSLDFEAVYELLPRPTSTLLLPTSSTTFSASSNVWLRELPMAEWPREVRRSLQDWRAHLWQRYLPPRTWTLSRSGTTSRRM